MQRCIVVSLICCLLSGCATERRHPKLTSIGVTVGFAATIGGLAASRGGLVPSEPQFEPRRVQR